MSGSKPARFEWALRIGIRGAQVLSLLIGACAGALAEPALRVGVLAVGSPTEEGAKWQPLLSHLAKSLATPVELTASTHQGLNEKLAEGQIDVLISHPGHGIELLERREAIGPIATRLTRWGGSSDTNAMSAFGGVIFSLEGPRAPTTLAELSKYVVATPDTHWLGAYQMQAYEMLVQGLQPPEGGGVLRVGGNQRDVVYAVLDGRAAVGFVRTGLLEEMAALKLVDLQKIRILNAKTWRGFHLHVSTTLYPEWPVLLHPSVSAERGRQIATALLTFTHDGDAAVTGFTIPADYRSVATVLKANKAPPFENEGQALLAEIWRTHQAGVIGGISALGLLMIAGAFLVWEHRRLRRSFQRVGMLANASRDAVISIDARGAIKLWGRTAQRLFGPRMRRGVRFIQEAFPASAQPALLRLLQQTLEEQTAGIEQRCESQALDAQGNAFPVELILKLVQPNAKGTQTAALAFVRDLRPELTQLLRTRLMTSVFTHAREGITITDPKGNILDVNPAFTSITGYERSEVLGRNPRVLQSGRQSAEFYQNLWNTLLSDGQWSGEIWNRRKSGEIYPEILSISAVRDEHEELHHFVAVFTDITELKRHQQRLEQVAHFDALTGLPNRALLSDRLSQATAHAHRHERRVAVVHLDVDQFTLINERQGQGFGDELLKMLATRLQHTLREDDTVARVGGDEFIVLLCDMDTPQSTQEVVERLRELIAEPFHLHQQNLHLSASYGVAVFPDDSDSPERILRGAEQASYRAKQLGRNTICYFDAAHDAAIKSRHEAIAGMRRALVGEQFLLHYQPKVNMATRRVIGVEALIRWQHPDRGLVPPGEFLPLIQDDPFELELGDWVIRTAIQQARTWQAMGLYLGVSINVTGDHLLSPQLQGRIAEWLTGGTPLQREAIEFEILESSALSDLQAIEQVLRQVRTLGVDFALDDFGTGYSSLAYLKHLPIGTLKIDQSFVRGMAHSAGDRAIVEAVISLAKVFDRRVIAEGVENAHLAQLLVELGCELGQGYAFSKPIPAEQIPGWIAAFENAAART